MSHHSQNTALVINRERTDGILEITGRKRLVLVQREQGAGQDLDTIDDSYSRTSEQTAKGNGYRAGVRNCLSVPRRISEVSKHINKQTNSPRDKRVSEATFLISSVSDWHSVTSILMLSVACQRK